MYLNIISKIIFYFLFMSYSSFPNLMSQYMVSQLTHLDKTTTKRNPQLISLFFNLYYNISKSYWLSYIRWFQFYSSSTLSCHSLSSGQCNYYFPLVSQLSIPVYSIISITNRGLFKKLGNNTPLFKIIHLFCTLLWCPKYHSLFIWVTLYFWLTKLLYTPRPFFNLNFHLS